MSLMQQWQNTRSFLSNKAGQHLGEHQVGLLKKYLPASLLVLVIAILAWQLSVFTWFLLSEKQPDDLSMAESTQQPTEQAAPQRAEAYDLFDVEPEVVIQKAEQPVRRNLNLLLHGTIAQPDPKQGSALISPKNAVPQVYRVGEQVSPGVILDEIYPTYVLLLRGNDYEQLSLPKDNLGLSTNVVAAARADLEAEPVVIRTPQVTRKLARYRKQLKDNPMALARLLNSKPIMRDGNIHGIEVSRGNDPTLISEIGLQDKDVLLSLNGIALNDIKQLPTLIKTLSEEERFEVELERDGVAQAINIYLEM